MSITKVHSHIDTKLPQYLQALKQLVAQPSISAQNIGVVECAHLLQSIMEDNGIKSQLYETPRHPLIYGEVKSSKPNAFTLLFYGHYDVQPPEPLEEWKSPPFEPTIREGRLYGRGVADNKGQLLAHIFALSSYVKTMGSLPITIKFLFEGEEESGSPHISSFVKENKDLLKTDLVFTSDGPMDTGDIPVILFGVRGILQVDLQIRTASFDNHSGNKGGVIANAAWELVHLLSTMKDREDRITIDGFYDGCLPPKEHDLELIKKLPYNPEQFAKDFGVASIDLEKEDFYKRLSLEPTLTINGLLSGYTGAGSKTIIPGYATAKLDIRLVHPMDPFAVLEKIKDHVAKVNDKVEVVYKGHMLPSRTDSQLPFCKKIIEGAEKVYGAQPLVMPSCGGSLPDYVWTKDLGVPSVIVPYANADEANHSPNENLRLDCFYKGIHASAQVIHELGAFQREIETSSLNR